MKLTMFVCCRNRYMYIKYTDRETQQGSVITQRKMGSFRQLWQRYRVHCTCTCMSTCTCTCIVYLHICQLLQNLGQCILHVHVYRMLLSVTTWCKIDHTIINISCTSSLPPHWSYLTRWCLSVRVPHFIPHHLHTILRVHGKVGCIDTRNIPGYLGRALIRIGKQYSSNPDTYMYMYMNRTKILITRCSFVGYTLIWWGWGTLSYDGEPGRWE